MKQLIVSIGAAFLLSATSHSGGDAPAFGPRTFVPGDAAPVAAAGTQLEPVICKGGDQFLVVWTDNSSSISHLAWEQSGSDVVAMRLDSTGAPIDETPFTVSRDFGYQRRPKVVWSGQSWVVGWENQSPTSGYYESRIVATRVSSAGEVLDEPFEPFPNNAGNDFHMASNGVDVVFVTQSYSAGEGGLLAQRMSAGGVLQGGPVVLAPETFYLYFYVDIDSAGGEYLITYNTNTSPVVQRFSASLQPIGGPVAIPGRRLIASNGSQYFLVFDGGPFGNTLMGSPMNVDGSLVVPGGLPLHDMSTGAIWSLDAAFSEGVWWLSYDEAWNGLSFQRMTSAGALLDPDLFVYPGVDRDWVDLPKVAGLEGGGVVTVWHDYRSITGAWPSEIYTGLTTGPTDFEDPAPLSIAAPSQIDPEIEPGPGHYLLTFASRRSMDTRIMAQRLTVAGDAIDLEPIEVGVATTVGGSPAAAWNGSLYLIAWNDGANVVFRRADAALNFLDSAPVVVMAGASPDVSALGDDFLVVTTAFGTYPQFRDAWARRINSAGQFMDPGRILLGGGYANFARVETFAGRWLATWQNNWTHDSPQSDVVANFVNANGTTQTPGGMGVASTSGGAGHPDIAAGPDHALFVWRSNSLANANNDVQCRRMNPDGTMADPANVMVSAAPYRQLFPVAEWTGSEYFMAWDDRRDAETFYDARDNVYGSRISREGAVVDPAGIALYADPSPEITPAIASLGPGRFLVAASVFRPELGMQSYRIAVRAVGASCPADLNADFAVDFADLNMLLSNYGQSGGAIVGDVNGDGSVDFADLNLMLSVYGQAC